MPTKFRRVDLEAQKSDDEEDIDESENNDDDSDVGSSVSSHSHSHHSKRSEKKSSKKPSKKTASSKTTDEEPKSWMDWIYDNRYIIGILVVVAIIAIAMIYFFSFRATKEAQDINTERQKLGEFGPGPGPGPGGSQVPLESVRVDAAPKTPAEMAAAQLSKMNAAKHVRFEDSAPSAFSALAVSGPPPKVPTINMSADLRAELEEDDEGPADSRHFTGEPEPSEAPQLVQPVQPVQSPQLGQSQQQYYQQPTQPVQQPRQDEVVDTIYTPAALESIVTDAETYQHYDDFMMP